MKRTSNASTSGKTAKTAKTADTTAPLGEQALAIIDSKASGFDSYELAEQLGQAPQDIEAALEPAVQAHALVVCAVQRGARVSKHYRLSAGLPAGFDWRAQGQQTWEGRVAGQAQQAQQAPAPTTDFEGAPKGVKFSGAGLFYIDPAQVETTINADTDFICALDSEGTLRIDSAGVAIELPLGPTRQLLHYLQHMHASHLVVGIDELTS